MIVELISQMIEANGKTVYENNLEIKHSIPIGTLVEVIAWDDECDYAGMRMFVADHSRDCDGSPLYTLGSKSRGYSGGFDEDNLKRVEI